MSRSPGECRREQARSGSAARRRAAATPVGLVAFRPDDALLARLARERARAGLLLRALVAAAHEGRVLFEVARADLEADRHALLDPLPRFVAAAHVATIEMHTHWRTRVDLRLELGLQRLAVRHHAVAILGLL